MNASATNDSRLAHFLDGLRLPRAHERLAYDNGWMLGDAGIKTDFLPCSLAADVAWSAEHEALHEEPSKTHFIDVFTRRFCLKLLSGRVGVGTIFCDVGCSTGYLLEDVAARFPGGIVVGTDVVTDGLSKCHRRHPEALLFQADILDLPFEDGSLDAFACVNVLEHVDDDPAALRELHRVLRPGGRGVLVVPAGRHLFDCYDEVLLHFRRYSRRELIGKAKASGFTVVHAASLGWTLYPLFAATKRWNQWRYRRRSKEDKLARVEAAIRGTKDSRIGHVLLGLEEVLLGRVAVPVGIRHVMVVEKPESG